MTEQVERGSFIGSAFQLIPQARQYHYEPDDYERCNLVQIALQWVEDTWLERRQEHLTQWRAEHPR